MEDDESPLYKAVKGIMYVLIIGAVYYSGGYGWALLFTKDEEKRERVGKYNLLIAVFGIIIWLAISMIDLSKNPPINYNPITFYLADILLLQLAISFIGMILYVLWYVFTRFF